MAKELLRIEELDEGVKVTCEDTREMAAAVGAFLYKAIMDRNTDYMMALLEIFMVISGLLDSKEDREGLLGCIKAALYSLEGSAPRGMVFKPSKIKS